MYKLDLECPGCGHEIQFECALMTSITADGITKCPRCEKELKLVAESVPYDENWDGGLVFWFSREDGEGES